MNQQKTVMPKLLTDSTTAKGRRHLSRLLATEGARDSPQYCRRTLDGWIRRQRCAKIPRSTTQILAKSLISKAHNIELNSLYLNRHIGYGSRLNRSHIEECWNIAPSATLGTVLLPYRTSRRVSRLFLVCGSWRGEHAFECLETAFSMLLPNMIILPLQVVCL